MTQSVNREFFGLARFGLFSPPYLSLKTIRNQTLPTGVVAAKLGVPVVAHQFVGPAQIPPLLTKEIREVIGQDGTGYKLVHVPPACLAENRPEIVAVGAELQRVARREDIFLRPDGEQTGTDRKLFRPGALGRRPYRSVLNAVGMIAFCNQIS